MITLAVGLPLKTLKCEKHRALCIRPSCLSEVGETDVGGLLINSLNSAPLRQQGCLNSS